MIDFQDTFKIISGLKIDFKWVSWQKCDYKRMFPSFFSYQFYKWKNITKVNEIIRIDWFEKLNILLLSRNMVLWQSLTLKNAKMIFIWKQSKTQTCGSCLQDFKWLQTVPFKSTAGRIPKRYECNEQNGVDFQYIGSRETIYVVKIFRVNTCCSFRNTYSFPSIGYSDWSV